jgi:predicted phosphodiesterase
MIGGRSDLLRYAIISDIHSNLEALQAVLKTIEQEKIDKIVCLGDIVGYGPYPNECIELVQQNCEIILTGNHDFACIESSELFYFNEYAAKAIEWTVTVLSKENLEYLATLSLVDKIENFYLVHSSPFEPQSWDYILSLSEAKFNFSNFNDNAKICFIGHSHHPIMFIEYLENNKPDYTFKLVNQIQLEENNRYIINVGSVGQPRDSNPDAAFGIVDTTTQEYELKRVKYDVNKTFQKMVSVGLPQFLADRLLIGR